MMTFAVALPNPLELSARDQQSLRKTRGSRGETRQKESATLFEKRCEGAVVRALGGGADGKLKIRTPYSTHLRK